MSTLEQPNPTTFSQGELLREMEQIAPFPPSSGDNGRLVEGYGDVYLANEPALGRGRPSLYLLVGPSGVGQDSLMQAMSDSGMEYVRLKTATTRNPRPGEEEDAYLWMSAPGGLGQNEIIAWLTTQYDLVECQYHCGSYYGTPMSSIEDAFRQYPQLPIVAKSECAGAEAMAISAGERINVVTIGLVPENYEQLLSRISSRGNVLSRILDAMKIATMLPRIAHYIVRNREVLGDPEAGINNTAHQLSRLILSLQNLTREGTR